MNITRIFELIFNEKDKVVKYSILLVVLFISCVIVLDTYIKKEPTKNMEYFEFVPEVSALKFALRDYIDSEEKVQAILNCDLIKKDPHEKVQIGAMVSSTGGGFTLISKRQTKTLYNLYKLSNYNTIDYSDGYKFIPNYYSTYLKESLGMIIKNKVMIDNIKLAKNLGNIDEIQRLKIGNYIMIDSNNEYYITSDENMRITDLRTKMIVKKFDEKFLIVQNTNIIKF